MSDTNATANVETAESAGTSTEAQNVSSEKATDTGAENSNQQKDNQAKSFNQDEVNSIVKKAEKKAAENAVKALEEQRKTAELSDIERANKERDDAIERENGLKSQLRTQAIKGAARDAADDLKLSFEKNGLDSALKLGLFDDVELDETGNVLGITDALTKIQNEYPFLLKQGTTRRKAPELDADAAGGSNAVMSDAEVQEVARKMGLPMPAK